MPFDSIAMWSLHAPQVPSTTHSHIISMPNLPQVTSRYDRVRFTTPNALLTFPSVPYRYFKRIDLALAQHKMPEEYSETYSYVYCNDCEKKSHARYHFIYHKCGHCKGYNSKVLGTVVGLPSDAVIAPEVVIPPSTADGPTPASHPDQLTRLASSNSIISSNSGSGSGAGSMDSDDYPASGYWCHQCQVYFN